MDGVRQRAIVAGVLTGVGAGMLLDGMVFHQLLQWHHLLSSTEAYAPTSQARLEDSVRADGWFALAGLVVLLAGTLAVWSVARLPAVDWSGSTLAATLLMGAAGFNVFDGLVNHVLLDLHTLREATDRKLAYDLAYVLVDLALVAAAVVWLRVAARAPRAVTGRARSAPRPR
jgi:uncharacterized membrane protein